MPVSLDSFIPGTVVTFGYIMRAGASCSWNLLENSAVIVTLIRTRVTEVRSREVANLRGGSVRFASIHPTIGQSRMSRMGHSKSSALNNTHGRARDSWAVARVSAYGRSGLRSRDKCESCCVRDKSMGLRFSSGERPDTLSLARKIARPWKESEQRRY